MVRWNEILIRPVEAMLSRALKLDGRPLTDARLPQHRLIGDCRHFSVLLCSMLRQQGVPARTRVGFASYLAEGIFMDHWLCEYWDAQNDRWVMVDADAVQTDVPNSRFLVAGRAWQVCRSGEISPERFHLFNGHSGTWCVRDDLVHDLAALNKMESLSFDVWGTLMERQADEFLSVEEIHLLDRVAALHTADEGELHELRTIYESDERLRMPERISYYTRDRGGKVGPLRTVVLAPPR